MLLHSRRTFVKTAIGATAVVVMKWPPPLQAGDPVQPPPSPGWGPVAGQARYRIDGIAKVTGQKIYARDFHPHDIPGWPATAVYAYLLRAVHADRPFLGLDLDKLPAGARPTRVFLQKDLDAAGIVTPWFDNLSYTTLTKLMVEQGSAPLYLGQPVAMLIFGDAGSCNAASRLLQFDPAYVNYGAPQKVATPGTILGDPYYFIRYSQDGKEIFSQVIAEASVDPAASPPTPCDLLAKSYQKKIESLLIDAPAHGWRLFRSRTSTQTIDPMFMEPQSGMGYIRGVDGKLVLDLVVGTQSPDGDATTLPSVLTKNTPSLIQVYSCYPGGGFGGRDTSLFPYFLAIAASLMPEHVVRLEYDRFGQFQSGLKRNGSTIDQTFAVTSDGTLQAVKSNITIVGGGKMNYSPYVAELAGICGAGAYAVPMNDILAQAQQTIGPTAGSMRGFGGPQAFFAVEHLMDEIAGALKIDRIDLRLRNVLTEGGHTVTGAQISAPLALREICQRAKENPLWKNRDAERRRRAGGATRYGVGFAIANQAFGTGTDPVLGNVAIEPDGRVIVTTNAVDMGNGAATALALATSTWLGTNASSIDMGNASFYEVLNLTTHANAEACGTAPSGATRLKAAVQSRGGHAKHAMKQRPRTESAEACPPPAPAPWKTNPCYTASLFASSSACITAFHQRHIIDQVSHVLFLTGIWPAALSLWKIEAGTMKPGAAPWKNGRLIAPELPALSLSALAAEAYRLGLTTGVTAHALYQGQWVAADWTVAGTLYRNWPIDALAVRPGSGPYTRVVRENVVPPPVQAQYYGRSLYAPSGTLAAVEIEKRTGAIRLIDIVTYVDAGRPIQRQLLAGQYEGAVAMGFGYTFLEHMPQGIGGPGDGTWNLNRYGLALAGDLPPLERMQLVTLREDRPSKGIAEAVLCPIPPALANAASNATGKFYRSLPITAEQLREVVL
jgi:CO/xanthine dehydrogenase Mo-binding subunit